MSSPLPTDYTIARGIGDIDLLRALERYLRSHPESSIATSRTELEDELGREIGKQEAESLFTGLVLNGVAEQGAPSSSFADYEFIIDSESAADVMREQTVARMAIERISTGGHGVDTDVRLTATVPPHIDVPEGVQLLPTAEELRQLFFGADHVLRLANPYFDPAPTVIGDLASLPNRGVEFRLLTRETTDGNRGMATTLNRIHARIPEEAETLFRVRDLFELDSTTGRQAFATHAKVAIADEEICYIGSANLTDTSLSTNFELGVLMQGPMVTDVISIFDYVFEEGRAVNLPL